MGRLASGGVADFRGRSRDALHLGGLLRRYTITRFAHLPGAEVGILTGDGVDEPIWTLERPWLNNERWVSCIPCGSYKLRRWASKKFPVALEVIGEEPARSDVLIHPANWVRQLRGCIALGRILGGLTGAPTIGESMVAVRKLVGLVGDGVAELVIQDGHLELVVGRA